MDTVTPQCNAHMTLHNGRTASDSWNSDKASDLGVQSCPENDSPECLVPTLSSSSEEQMLDSAFQMCDTDGRGIVSVSRIIEYLQSVTEPSRDGDRLECLCKMLDPDEKGVLINRQTFHMVMSKWIASCCQDRITTGITEEGNFMKDGLLPKCEEKVLSSDAHIEGYGGDDQKCIGAHADLTSKLEDLNMVNKKLIDQKSKLQRNLELAEETNSHMAEEITDLKNKLKSLQQAVHYTQSINNELEDMKSFAKSLEEEICTLKSQKKLLWFENGNIAIWLHLYNYLLLLSSIKKSPYFTWLQLHH
ncbi:protein KASH5 [Discoglossus pictus]